MTSMTEEILKTTTVIIILSIVMLVVLLIDFSNEDEDLDRDSSFVCVETTSINKIVYHKETKVMYAISTGRNNKGVFTMLVDEDGNPMIWKD